MVIEITSGRSGIRGVYATWLITVNRVRTKVMRGEKARCVGSKARALEGARHALCRGMPKVAGGDKRYGAPPPVQIYSP